jgi:hypothetical protein
MTHPQRGAREIIGDFVCGAVLLLALGLGSVGVTHAQSKSQEAVEVSSSDGVWTVFTVAPDGSWGAATETMSSRAIANAVAQCTSRYGAEIGCGGYIVEIRQGWVLGIRCGNETILAAARALADAERIALRREHELRTIYVRDMPPCRRLVTIDPGGAVIAVRHKMPGR